MYKKLIYICFVFSIIINLVKGHPVYAWDISLLVNDENLNFQIQHLVYTYSGNPLFLGGEVHYNKRHNETSSWIFSPYLFASSFYKKPIDVSLGFKGSVGKLEFPSSEKKDVFNLGFMFKLLINFKKYLKINLFLDNRFIYAPKILSFEDCEREIAIDVALGWKINRASDIVVAYKFDKFETYDEDWELDTILVGTRIHF
jgi:hypothetical protein